MERNSNHKKTVLLGLLAALIGLASALLPRIEWWQAAIFAAVGGPTISLLAHRYFELNNLQKTASFGVVVWAKFSMLLFLLGGLALVGTFFTPPEVSFKLLVTGLIIGVLGFIVALIGRRLK